MRYFRATVQIYSEIAAALDAAYGYPNAETKTERTLPLVGDLPRDKIGRVYLAVNEAYCDYILPARLLAELLESGSVEEISESTYAGVATVPV